MDYNLLNDKLTKCINFLTEEYSLIRAGRANPQILNKIEVSYYGTPTPLIQIASVSVPEARQILVTPWEKSLLTEIEKAILKADLNLTPINDGQNIRINFPELNETRRIEITKEVKEKAEDTKVSIRNIRREFIDILKAEKLPEDETKREEENIQKEIDKFIEQVSKLCDNKTKEIMEI